jgi:hypothetical protein
MIYSVTISILVGSFLSEIATITVCVLGFEGSCTTIVDWTLVVEVFVTAETTVLDLETVFSNMTFFTTFWIVGFCWITLISLVLTIWLPVTESILISVLIYLVGVG